jgi:hypothetical protein
VAAWIGFAPLVANAALGLVRTLDGHTTPQGEVHLLPPSTLVWVEASGGDPLRVDLTNLLRAVFLKHAGPPEEVRLAGSEPVRAAETGQLPSFWRGIDIGAMDGRGRAAWTNGVFFLETWRGRNRSERDGFHFTYQPMQGNGEIAARIVQLEDHPGLRASLRPSVGIMMCSDLGIPTSSVFLGVRPRAGYIFRVWNGKRRRQLETDLARILPPYWLKLVRDGNSFAGYRSWDGQRWMLLTREDLEMPETIHVGLAFFSRNPKGSEHAEMDQVSLRGLTPDEPFLSRLILADGSVMVGTVESADATSVQISRRQGEPILLTHQVAAFQFRPIPRNGALSFERRGVVQANGDFLDADFIGLESNRLQVSSVLYGPVTLAAHDEVAAMVLQAVTPRPATYAVKTVEGSVWQAEVLTIETGGLRVSNPIAGQFTIPWANLLEIRRNLQPR